MGKSDAAWPKVRMPVVDVRDVAKAHLEGLKRPEAANQRFLLVSEGIWACDIHKHLLKDFDNCYKIQKG